MRNIAALLAALALAACAAAAPEPPPAPPSPPAPPAGLGSCPPGAAVPQAPRPPRSIEAIARYAVALEEARFRTELARRECARRLAELRDLWPSPAALPPP